MGIRCDTSLIRRCSSDKNMPMVDLVLKTIDELLESGKLRERATLLGICPISHAAIRAAVECAKFLNFPLMFVTTLNQVDIDGGYTGLTQKDFVETIARECKRLEYDGPLIIALDHGGPWLKDKHVIEGWGFDEAMEWIKKSIEECIKAGYDLLHIDTTVDIRLKEGEVLEIDTIVERTVELIEHAENVRSELGIPRISYEVGTEEVHGGITSPQIFQDFILKLKSKLKQKGLESVWPCFIVGNVGTFLAEENRFDPERAAVLVEIAKSHNLYVKGHYTDYVSNPEDYPKAGMGGANIGPELAHSEYLALEELDKLERALAERKLITEPSRILENLNNAIISSGRWKKWLRREEKGLDFSQLSPKRRRWLLGTGARYVLSTPEIVKLREQLYRNLKAHGVKTEERILTRLRETIEKYVNSFNLRNLTFILEERLIEKGLD